MPSKNNPHVPSRSNESSGDEKHDQHDRSICCQVMKPAGVIVFILVVVFGLLWLFSVMLR